MGFEPTNSYLLNDFESFAFDHSATSPAFYKYAHKKEEVNRILNEQKFLKLLSDP